MSATICMDCINTQNGFDCSLADELILELSHKKDFCNAMLQDAIEVYGYDTVLKVFEVSDSFTGFTNDTKDRSYMATANIGYLRGALDVLHLTSLIMSHHLSYTGHVKHDVPQE